MESISKNTCQSTRTNIRKSELRGTVIGEIQKKRRLKIASLTISTQSSNWFGDTLKTFQNPLREIEKIIKNQDVLYLAGKLLGGGELQDGWSKARDSCEMCQKSESHSSNEKLCIIREEVQSMVGDRINRCAFIILRKEIITYASHGGHSKGNGDI